MAPRLLELLAPAKNLAGGIAAIDHGADAVYIGGPRFGARAAVGNSLEDIKHLVRYGHQFRARVYVALNTLLRDDELARAVELIHQLYDLGVDAIIIQDVGLLECELPPIALHSSTQMDNTSVEKVRFLEAVGFQQVVLARELHLDQISAISTATEVTLECFIHGALCVSYSGRCYISEAMAGQSGNRGACAQFCRHKYSLKDRDGTILEKNKYLLSLKDLNLSDHLRTLIDAGVSSFKIEGRLKDERYVKNVTAYYRQALDNIIASDARLRRSSAGSCSYTFTPDLIRTFNRGYTDYFLKEKRNNVVETRSPKSVGKLLGTIKSLHGDSFILHGTEKVHNGDGLCFFHQKQGLVGFRVNRVDNNRIFPKQPPAQLQLTKGVEIYRNFDIQFTKSLDASSKCRTIDLKLELYEVEAGLQLKIVDEDGVVSTCTANITKQAAIKKGSLRNIAEKQLKKCGDTLFRVKELTVDLSEDLYFPVRELNETRRKGLENHFQTRLDNYQVPRFKRSKNSEPWISNQLSFSDNILNSKAVAFYERHGVNSDGSRVFNPSKVESIELMTTKHCIKYEHGVCEKVPPYTKVKEPLYIEDNSGCYSLLFDCKKCEMRLLPKDKS